MKKSSFLASLSIISTIHLIQCTPTMVEFKNFDAQKDANAMQEALTPKNANTAAIEDIISNRNCSQRMEISSSYYKVFHKFIIEPIADRTDGIYEQLLKDSFICGDMILAVHLRRALKDADNSKRSVIEIMVSHTQSEERHRSLAEIYKTVVGQPYEETIKEKLDGDFENVLLEMVAKVRQPKQAPNEAQAKDTAQKLNDGIDKWGDDRKLLDETLMVTNFEQLNVIFQKFKEINGKELEEVVQDQFEGDKRSVYQNLIHFCKAYSNNFVEYFTNKLFEAVNGERRDDLTLTRVILTHSEIDLKEIRDQFQKSYNKNLLDEIGKENSGQFENLLKKFVNGNAQLNQPKK